MGRSRASAQASRAASVAANAVRLGIIKPAEEVSSPVMHLGQAAWPAGHEPCHVCRSAPKVAACRFCDKPSCGGCAFQCSACEQSFCRFCVTTDYAGPHEATFCLSCMEERQRTEQHMTHVGGYWAGAAAENGMDM